VKAPAEDRDARIRKELRAMKKASNDRRTRRGAGRVRALQDIRTLGALRKPTPAGLRLASADVGAEPKPPAPAKSANAHEPPRTWVFVKQPRFSRHQGALTVHQLAEPEVDLFEHGQSLVVLAKLPGVRHKDVEVHVHGDILVLSTRPNHDDRRRYYRELLLPFSVSSKGIHRKFRRNDVLELEFHRASPPSPHGPKKHP
jgi:HSP20 family molecular chaperone IbpA